MTRNHTQMWYKLFPSGYFCYKQFSLGANFTHDQLWVWFWWFTIVVNEKKLSRNQSFFEVTNDNYVNTKFKIFSRIYISKIIPVVLLHPLSAHHITRPNAQSNASTKVPDTHKLHITTSTSEIRQCCSIIHTRCLPARNLQTEFRAYGVRNSPQAIRCARRLLLAVLFALRWTIVATTKEFEGTRVCRRVDLDKHFVEGLKVSMRLSKGCCWSWLALLGSWFRRSW